MQNFQRQEVVYVLPEEKQICDHRVSSIFVNLGACSQGLIIVIQDMEFSGIPLIVNGDYPIFTKSYEENLV
jgi:hypothetical protein